MSGVARRVRRLEGPGGLVLGPKARAYAADLAAASGLDAGSVLAEAQAVLDRAAAAGATSARGLAAWLARTDGRDADELLAEAERAVTAWRAGR